MTRASVSGSVLQHCEQAVRRRSPAAGRKPRRVRGIQNRRQFARSGPRSSAHLVPRVALERLEGSDLETSQSHRKPFFQKYGRAEPTSTEYCQFQTRTGQEQKHGPRLQAPPGRDARVENITAQRSRSSRSISSEAGNGPEAAGRLERSLLARSSRARRRALSLAVGTSSESKAGTSSVMAIGEASADLAMSRRVYMDGSLMGQWSMAGGQRSVVDR